MNRRSARIVCVLSSLIALLLIFPRGARAQTPWTIPNGVDQHALSEFQPFNFKEPLPRKTRFEDMLPMLPISELVDKGVIENWWYNASLKGSDGKEYVLVYNFDHSRVMGLHFMFSELGAPDKPLPPPLYRAQLTKEKFEVDLASKRVTFVYSDGQGQQVRTEIFAPEGMDVTAELNHGFKLELRFRSRGTPYCYPQVGSVKGNVFESGFEDLSLVEGALYSNNTKIQLSGTGVQERVRWSWVGIPLDITIPPVVTKNDWFPINLDRGYVLVDRGKDIYGQEFRSGAVSIDGQYWYVSDPGKIKIELTGEADEWPAQAHIVMDTDGGRLELFGTLEGKAMNVPEGKGYVNYPIYDFKGTFTYKDGRSLALSGGGNWLEHRRVIPGKF